MKKLFSLIIIFLLIFNVTQAKVEFSKELFEKLAKNKNKVPEIDIPDFEKVELKNGMTIYLVEDHSLPLIEVEGYIKGGRKQETKDIAGISSFMFQLMNTGTENYSENDLQEFKNIHGIGFGFSVKNDYFEFSGNSLSEDKEYLFNIMAEILRNPKFDRKYYRRIMMERYKNLSQAMTQEVPLRDMYFYRNLFAEHPYSFSHDLELQSKSLANINPKRIMKYYNDNLSPDIISFGIVGDFETKEMKKMIKKNFGDWKKKEIELRNPEVKKLKDNKKVILVNKPDATQAKIRMGYNFYGFGFKDRVPFMMANRVFGSGSFQCRLIQNLRVDKGYVYAAFARASYNKLGGSYSVSTEVKPENTYETLQIVKEEMNNIIEKKDPIKEKELFEIINLYNGIFPKFYKTKNQVLSTVLYNLEIRGRSADYTNKYIKKFNNLTLDEVQGAFEKYTNPDNFFTVIVGNKKDILPQLEENNIDVKIVDM
ncbi:MAG TPA: pitrilysin family protein [Candidatus Mcinerneyibacterium sp.]|nr:pitrilysin family protein [Candidatus Mcinerneyibacterium sp.]